MNFNKKFQLIDTNHLRTYFNTIMINACLNHELIHVPACFMIVMYVNCVGQLV